MYWGQAENLKERHCDDLKGETLVLASMGIVSFIEASFVCHAILSRPFWTVVNWDIRTQWQERD